VILTLLAILVATFLGWLLLTYAIFDHREIYERFPLFGLAAPVRDSVPAALAFLFWILLCCGGVFLALCGSTRALPWIARMTRRPLVYRLAWVGNAFLVVMVFVVAAATVHASSLTRQDDEPAQVYLLYDDMGLVPRWVFNLGFYRISLAASERWGPGSVVVAPLDEHHLELALQHGHFVFLACHGINGNIALPDFSIFPQTVFQDDGTPTNHAVLMTIHDSVEPEPPWVAPSAGKSLRLVYNSGCDCGGKAMLWEAALAPAEVKTFDRLSTVAEHIVWLWVDGPERVRGME
jgi:hypothetical protein